MKVLLSAFSCDPYKGSEPSVGWGWVETLARHNHEVVVLVSGNHSESNIRKYLNENEFKNTTFEYIFLPSFLYNIRSFFPQVYYYFWQIKAIYVAKKLARYHKFDLVHHATYVNIKHPSFLWILNKKFIFGPVSGGDSVPVKLRKSANLKQRIRYSIRDLSKLLTTIDPFARLCIKKADVIHVTTESTMHLIPTKYHKKVKKTFAIAFENNSDGDSKVKSILDGRAKIIYAGMFQHLKGMQLGIPAFAKVHNKHDNLTLTLIGSGEEKKHWKNLVIKNKIEKSVEWIQWLSREDLLKKYDEHHIILFPSLQDSGGMVLLEAMSKGLVPIVLNLGGPAEICDDSCSEIVDVRGLDEEQVIDEIAKRLENLTNNPEVFESKSRLAILKAAQFNWDTKYNNVYGL